jgi:hypothetical protein
MIMPQETGSTVVPLTNTEVLNTLVNAYIFGYPLVTMEMTRRVMTNVEASTGTRAPIGHFAHMKSYPDASFRDVTAPNADTLYSAIWIDLSSEPYVFSIPDSDGRYFLMPLLDAWTNVFHVPGSRTTGTNQQRFAISGPSYKGRLPDYMTHYKSTTNLVWIIGRTYCNGTPDDYDKAHAFQEKLSMVPISAYEKPYAAPPGRVHPQINMTVPVRNQVNALDVRTYFNILCASMKNNPPVVADAEIVAQMAQVGLIAGEQFSPDNLDAEVREAMPMIADYAVEQIMEHAKHNKTMDGWMYCLDTGTYGTNYLQRAFITAIALGANRPQDAVYSTSEADPYGNQYNGANKYVMHFDVGRTPPVNAFWSLTMYDENFFFIDNPLNRFNVSSRTNFKRNDDGSIDIYIQRESPGAELETNWLPAPAGRFKLMMRMYWPKAEVSQGRFSLPPVLRAQ